MIPVLAPMSLAQALDMQAFPSHRAADVPARQPPMGSNPHHPEILGILRLMK
jgi:hypothetical protein